MYVLRGTAGQSRISQNHPIAEGPGLDIRSGESTADQASRKLIRGSGPHMNGYMLGIQGELFWLTLVYIVQRFVLGGESSRGAGERQNREKRDGPQAPRGTHEEDPVRKRATSNHVGDLDIDQ